MQVLPCVFFDTVFKSPEQVVFIFSVFSIPDIIAKVSCFHSRVLIPTIAAMGLWMGKITALVVVVLQEGPCSRLLSIFLWAVGKIHKARDVGCSSSPQLQTCLGSVLSWTSSLLFLKNPHDTSEEEISEEL